MATIYATLIVNGKKSFNDVPITLKNDVKQVLIDLELGRLVE